MSDARFFRIVASGERDAQKPFCRKCDVIYRGNVRFVSEQTGIEQSAGRNSFMRRDGSRACCAFEKSFEDLAADVFAFRSARGDDVCAHWPRSTTKRRVTWTLLPAAGLQPPMAFHRPILFADTLTRSFRRATYY